MELSKPSTSASTISQEDSFVWDESSQLYYHARSGFYHDPGSGWYYSSSDGLYYTFADGEYVLLDTYEVSVCYSLSDVSVLIYRSTSQTHFLNGDQSENCRSEHEPTVIMQAQSEPCAPDNGDQYGSFSAVEDEGLMVSGNEEVPEIPPPTSEWLEDTLIDLFLARNSERANSVADDQKQPLETDNAGISDDLGQEEASWEEENWRAQYGQAIHHEEKPVQDSYVTDLWDWGIIQEPGKHESSPITRLVGRLLQPSTKVHPSMPTGGKRLRTTPICQVHLDLVRVRSGQVYRLRSPSAGYLATLSCYDSSNPTRDWGFPELSRESLPLNSEEPSTGPQISENEKRNNKSHSYRDRAAERRALHGKFSVGPGQKTSKFNTSPPRSPPLFCPEEAAAEALEISLGPDSYAQRILKNMGWKEGEALGRTKQGLTQPLQAVGNKGTVGLGWSQDRTS